MGNLHLPNQIASPHNLLERTPTFIGALILYSSSNQRQNDRIVESHRVKFNLNVVLVSKTWFWICSIYDSNWNAVLRHQQPILVWKAIFKSEKNILWFGYLIWARVFCEIKKAGSNPPYSVLPIRFSIFLILHWVLGEYPEKYGWKVLGLRIILQSLFGMLPFSLLNSVYCWQFW